MRDIGGWQAESDRRSIPAMWMRAGTSKGLFLRGEHLPKSLQQWEPILLAIMGSSNGDPRQLDGIGGGTSTTSKVAVVSRSKRPGFNLDYTFVQVDFARGRMDMSGNCGNMASGTGLFALYQGLVKPQAHQDQINVKVFAVNTGQELVVSVDLRGMHQECSSRHSIDHGPRPYPVKVTFLAPGGAMTGRLLPVNDAQTTLNFECPETGSTRAVRTTLIDCANPFVLVDSRSLPAEYHLDGPSGEIAKEIIERIRRAAMVPMGLHTTADRKAGRFHRGTPKIALLAMPRSSPPKSSSGEPARLIDVEVAAYSMGNLHPTLQLTGAICLGAALSVPGTVASDLLVSGEGFRSRSSDSESDISAPTSRGTRRWCIQHPTGSIETEVTTTYAADGGLFIESGSVFCSARKLFEGTVFY